MPVQTDAPIAIGSRDDWALGAGPSKLAAVATHDGDSSFVYSSSGGQQNVQLFRFPLLVGVTDPVTSALLQTWAREYEPGIGARYFYLYWNGAQVGSNWGEFYHSFPGYIGDGAYTAVAPTLAQVNGEHGFIGFGSGGPSLKWEIWLTQFYRSVTYSYAAGAAGDNFAHLIGSLAAAIGANLLMRDMPAVARTIQARTRILIQPSEYAEALRAWRSEKHMSLVGV